MYFGSQYEIWMFFMPLPSGVTTGPANPASGGGRGGILPRFATAPSTKILHFAGSGAGTYICYIYVYHFWCLALHRIWTWDWLYHRPNYSEFRTVCYSHGRSNFLAFGSGRSSFVVSVFDYVVKNIWIIATLLVRPRTARWVDKKQLAKKWIMVASFSTVLVWFQASSLRTVGATFTA